MIGADSSKQLLLLLLATMLCACDSQRDNADMHWQGETMGAGYSIHIQADAEARPRLAAMTDTLLERTPNARR